MKGYYAMRGKCYTCLVFEGSLLPAEEGTIVLGKINASKDNNFGYDALTGDHEDLVKAGSILTPLPAKDV